PQRHRDGTAAGGEGLLGGEGGGGGPGRRRVQQHTHRVAACVGDDEVGAAVAVDVPQRHRDGIAAGGEGRLGGEGGGDGPGRRRVQQHTHRGAACVGEEEVGAAVAVDVPQRHRDGTAAGGEGLLAGEGGAAGPGRRRVQQHTHRAA